MEDLAVLKIMVQAAADKKAEDILVQDLGGLSDLCRYQIICSAMNSRQAQAICDNLEESLKKEIKLSPFVVEGKKVGSWILLDYGSYMVHVFERSFREYYGLERLWAKAKIVDIGA